MSKYSKAFSLGEKKIPHNEVVNSPFGLFWNPGAGYQVLVQGEKEHVEGELPIEAVALMAVGERLEKDKVFRTQILQWYMEAEEQTPGQILQQKKTAAYRHVRACLSHAMEEQSIDFKDLNQVASFCVNVIMDQIATESGEDYG